MFFNFVLAYLQAMDNVPVVVSRDDTIPLPVEEETSSQPADALADAPLQVSNRWMLCKRKSLFST